jgi:anti-sigma factor RsiW
MSKCTSIDPLVTPYVDGELPAAERTLVDEHLHRCPPCLSRVAAESPSAI